MSGKLILLNLVLVGILAYGIVAARNYWRSEKARESATLNAKVGTAPAPPMTHEQPPPAVLPSSYAPIAQNMLFDRSRNSEVVVEVVPPPPPPPAPPVPPLPIYHGQMNIGEPIIILSVNANVAGEPVRRGGMIGPFKLVDFNTREIALEWNGQVIHKTVDEITRPSSVVEEAPQGRTEVAAPVAVSPLQMTQAGPGQATGNGLKTCLPNDNTPEGTVVDGYRKVYQQLPFGKACLWEPVR